ncbi:2-dehydro-3-deoxy-D-gluconate 5-dehydrogenase KduD [Weissella coleopterorum]|uniref:2-dehydro-3-deoxy-D-gluconate 5-dehydrogenase KduD n=1 Tax=Weissella coleopterorum TaxID=2714949 RepID=A0A6G8B1V3_9LACO|nr:2-dehydro-3-deoxy-D-gluconate 5-dehydrogenase KduD [Weissella coleopterorum]QIL51189.1 2-dehydro-3-deoxy-D-gluconate 5-dehydrogenase KduD [Weissella coleopterorum]
MAEYYEPIEEIQARAKDLQTFSMKQFSLTNKVAIVSGGNTGLGQAYVVAFAEAGADIYVPTFTSEGWEETKRLVEAKGRKVIFEEVDLTKEDAPKQVIEHTLSAFGHIDILVNNAGMIRRNNLVDSKQTDWDAVMNINLNVVYRLSMAVLPIFKKQNSGKIINIASMLSYFGGKFVPSYTASKHGVAGLTKAFASEASAWNIQVNAIAPGYIATSNTAPIRADQERNDEILGRIAAGHWGQTNELMGGVVFLASPASNYITGIIMPIDGGYLVR